MWCILSWYRYHPALCWTSANDAFGKFVTMNLSKQLKYLIKLYDVIKQSWLFSYKSVIFFSYHSALPTIFKNILTNNPRNNLLPVFTYVIATVNTCLSFFSWRQEHTQKMHPLWTSCCCGNDQILEWAH